MKVHHVVSPYKNGGLGLDFWTEYFRLKKVKYEIMIFDISGQWLLICWKKRFFTSEMLSPWKFVIDGYT